MSVSPISPSVGSAQPSFVPSGEASPPVFSDPVVPVVQPVVETPTAPAGSAPWGTSQPTGMPTPPATPLANPYAASYPNSYPASYPSPYPTAYPSADPFAQYGAYYPVALTRYPRDSSNEGLLTVAFAFMVIFTIVTGFAIIPLAWCIPMTVHANNVRKGDAPNTVAFGVCSLLFVALIPGILLLVARKDE